MNRLVLAGILYLGVSLLTFAVYGFDKGAARRREMRVPEVWLHALALGGGWPGALAGQQVYRHKTRKQPFRTVYWVTVVANLAGAWYWLSR